MKRFLKILAIVFGVIAVALATVAAWVQFTPFPTFEVHPQEVTLPTDSISLAQGKKIVETVCVHCHMGKDGKLSGRQFTPKDDPFGIMYSGNITQHTTKGIGRYTDGELAWLMRTGTNRDGRFVGLMMTHPNMSDQDLASIIAYLRSDAGIVQPSEAVHPKPEYLNSFLVKALVKLGLYKPLSFDGKPVPAIDPNDQIAYGRYLATEIFECSICRSASFETNDLVNPEKSPNFFGGGNPVPDEDFKVVLSANITPSQQHGIGNWTADQFKAAVRTGMRPDGKVLTPNMPRFGQLSDRELDAIWAYLQTVPAIEQGVKAADK